MKKHILLTIMILLVFGFILTGTPSFAEERMYKVTITNITAGQTITPPLLISHSRDFQLFELGSPAMPALVMLAEEGDPEPLIEHASGLPSVFGYSAASEALGPGDSVTLEFKTSGGFRFITAAGGLATTNDAFFAIRGIRVLPDGEKTVYALAYDAGTESNSESCKHIPGPPCGMAGVRNQDDAEGYIHIHSGIKGGADLDPIIYDWQNPVAEITIRSVR